MGTVFCVLFMRVMGCLFLLRMLMHMKISVRDICQEQCHKNYILVSPFDNRRSPGSAVSVTNQGMLTASTAVI